MSRWDGSDRGLAHSVFCFQAKLVGESGPSVDWDPRDTCCIWSGIAAVSGLRLALALLEVMKYALMWV